MSLIRRTPGEGPPDELATCVRCLQTKGKVELDRLLWCEDCRDRALRRARGWGWWAGALVAVALAMWIRSSVNPSDLLVGGWVGVVLATFYLSARIVREVGYGTMRFRNRRAADARPPESG